MQDLPRTWKIVTFWLLLATGVFVAVQFWLHPSRPPRVQISQSGGNTIIELPLGRDGHFHWPGRIGDTSIDFLVDTGATRSALPAKVAQAAGLESTGPMRSQTAGGVADGEIAEASIELEGGVRTERLPIAVLPHLDTPLLGMDVLGKLPLSQQNGVLRIERR